MKRLLPCLIMALLLPASVKAETVSQLFDAGVSEYRQGNFDRSAAIFLDLVEKYEVASPDVLANLGSAEFAAGRTGDAMLHLMMAKRLDPDGRAGQTAAVNLDRIRSLLNERQEGKTGSAYVFGGFTDPWMALFSWLPPPVALIAFLASWAVFFVALAFRRLLSPERSRTVTAMALVLTVATGFCAYATSRISGYRTGVVLAESTPLMTSLASTEPSATLPEGMEFRVIERRGAWVRIRLSSGLTGWIPESEAGIP